MKTLNSRSGSFVLSAQTPVDIDGRYPCFYANIEDYKWKVGCKHDGKTDEYSFKFSKLGNVNDSDFWDEVTSHHFAIKLIELFRQGGQKSVKKWIQDGRP